MLRAADFIDWTTVSLLGAGLNERLRSADPG